MKGVSGALGPKGKAAATIVNVVTGGDDSAELFGIKTKPLKRRVDGSVNIVATENSGAFIPYFKKGYDSKRKDLVETWSYVWMHFAVLSDSCNA